MEVLQVKPFKSSTNELLVSVIIAAGRPDITGTLQSLSKQTLNQKDYEIIVISELPELKSVESGEVKFIKASTGNPAVKRNAGASYAQGKILAFIDDDAFAPENWLETGLNILQNNPSYCGTGGPNLIPPHSNRKEQLTDIILNSPLMGSGHIAYSPQSAEREAKQGEVHLCNFFVWKDSFQEAGGLNEHIGYGCEDTEFIYQVNKKLGKKFFYSSRLYVYHHRREFGWSYIIQRFKLRTNNGRLTCSYPALYTRNIKFTIALFCIPVCFILLLKKPVILALIFCLYFSILVIYSLLKHRDFFPALPFALFMHHLTYSAGLFYGLLTGAVRFSKTMRMRR
jgi:glycosyltransferase involved in cell wall biosynthesis